MTDHGTGDGADAVFAALGDARRREVLELLAREGPATPTELAAVLPITRQAVSKHLAALDAAGLVEHARTGRETRYRAQPAAFTEVVAWMGTVGAQWDTRLARLDDLLP